MVLCTVKGLASHITKDPNTIQIKSKGCNHNENSIELLKVKIKMKSPLTCTHWLDWFSFSSLPIGTLAVLLRYRQGACSCFASPVMQGASEPYKRLCYSNSSIQCSTCPKHAHPEAVLFSRSVLSCSFYVEWHRSLLLCVPKHVN